MTLWVSGFLPGKKKTYMQGLGLLIILMEIFFPKMQG